MVLPPPEPSAAEATVTHFRASLFRGVIAQAQGAGPEAWEAYLQALPPTARRVFAQPLGLFQWIETGQVNALMAVHEQRFPPHLAEARVSTTVEEQLTVAHAWLLKLLSPETLLQQAPTLFRFYYRGGVCRVEHLGSGHGTILIWATGLFPSWYTHSLPIWVRRALTLTGGQDARVEHHPPLEGCCHRYRVHWKA